MLNEIKTIKFKDSLTVQEINDMCRARIYRMYNNMCYDIQQLLSILHV